MMRCGNISGISIYLDDHGTFLGEGKEKHEKLLVIDWAYRFCASRNAMMDV